MAKTTLWWGGGQHVHLSWSPVVALILEYRRICLKSFVRDFVACCMSPSSSVVRAPDWYMGGHGFDSHWGLRFFLCPWLVTKQIYHLSQFRSFLFVPGVNFARSGWKQLE